MKLSLMKGIVDEGNRLRGIYFLASTLTVDCTLNIVEDLTLWELINCLMGQSLMSRLLIS